MAKEIYQAPQLQGEPLCATTDPDLFSRERGEKHEKGEPSKLFQARRLCNVCELLEWCKADAVANPDPHMIKGGLTPTQQMKLHKKAKAA